MLHAAAVWLLLPQEAGRSNPDTPPLIEVELVQQAPKMRGATQAAPTHPASAQPPLAPSVPPVREADVPVAPPPARATQESPPADPSSVNLGGADDDQEGLVVSGPIVVPPQPDATIRNKPPSYPAEAVRRHAEGTVALRIHVTEAGVPGGVDVTASSGDASLDRAARDAVALWRFQPAREQGVPVAFDYDMTIHFTIGN